MLQLKEKASMTFSETMCECKKGQVNEVTKINPGSEYLDIYLGDE